MRRAGTTAPPRTWRALAPVPLVGTLALTVLALTVLAVVPGWAAPVAEAAPPSSCSTSAGVLVAVDLGHWGGPVERGCDPTTTTAYDALHAAGFTTAGDATDGSAFVCRIDDRPTLAQQSCQDTPPADAYWSFWYADAGSAGWTYAASGAQTFDPAPGSVEAWVFSGTDQGPGGRPVFTPAEVRAGAAAPAPTTTTRPTTTTVPTPPATVHPGTATTTTTTAAPATTVATTRPGHTTTTAPRRATTTTTGATTTTVAPTTSTTALRIVDAGPPAQHAGSGSPVGVIVGVVVVAALAGAGVVVGRRRAGRGR